MPWLHSNKYSSLHQQLIVTKYWFLSSFVNDMYKLSYDIFPNKLYFYQQLFVTKYKFLSNIVYGMCKFYGRGVGLTRYEPLSEVFPL